MKKIKKTTIWTIVLMIVFVFSYFFIFPLVFLSIKSSGPRKPKLEIKETHEIGWWSYNDSLKIDSIEIKIIESKLNLFNNESLISYRIKGGISYKNKWKPYIKEIHLSEKFTNPIDSLNGSPEAIIEITPIVGVEENESYTNEIVDFDIKNEKIIKSFHWGKNKIRFKSKDINYDIVLKQRK